MPDEPKLPTLAPPSAPPPTEADYEAIHAAVMDTARGRWFIGEYAKRNRNADTELILAAIDRAEVLARERPPVSAAERVHVDLMEMAKAIAQTRSEIAAIKPDGDKGSLSVATEELDQVVHTTEHATSDILAAAEQVQEIAWTLRERGADPEVCDALDRRATDIYTACSFQDLTGQRTRKVVDVLRFLEERIRAMIEIWGPAPASADLPVAPSLGNAAGRQLDQPDIDRIMPAPATAALEQATAAPPAAWQSASSPSPGSYGERGVRGAELPRGTSSDVSREDAPSSQPSRPEEGEGAPAPCQPYAIALDQAGPWLTLEPQPDPELAHEAAPVVAPQPEAPHAPDQAGGAAVPVPEALSEPEVAREPETATESSMAEPEAEFAPQAAAALRPEPEEAREPEPVTAPAPEAVQSPDQATMLSAMASQVASAPSPDSDGEWAGVRGAVPPQETTLDVTLGEAPSSPEEREDAPTPELACEPEAAADPAPEPAAAETPGTGHPDPAEMLRRILSLLRPPGPPSADWAASSAPQSESSGDGKLVSAVAVSEVDDAADGSVAISAETPSTPLAETAIPPSSTAEQDSILASMRLSGSLTVDQAVSELLLRALARAAVASVTTAAATPVPTEPVATNAPADVFDIPAPVLSLPPAADPRSAASNAAELVAGKSVTQEVRKAAATWPAVAEFVAAAAPTPARSPSPPATAVVLPLPQLQTQSQQPSRPQGLAAITALSDEDKIALFS